MIRVAPLKVDNRIVTGLKVELPDSPPLLMIIGETGFIMCGFLNIDAAEQANVAAAMVCGVKNFDDMLKAEIKAATSRAQSKGITYGIRGKEAIKLLL
ncbi:MAG: DUF1805 domain-containing protein [Candidatus Bathyarchaeota archaeon]|nr:MAG: DUF1805 domain-containing protein [Candidatus Bathyarchaeota archaeon]